jgi:DNA repair exonuclease SbcCD nuclease subunit
MKILHAADLHLDSPMVGLSAYEEAPRARLQMATRNALANLVELAIEEQVDLLLLAGDIFDGDWTHYGTGVHFITEMARLREAEIPVVMIAGNHDAQSKLTKTLPYPENVRLLSTHAPQSVIFEDLGVAVHGQGYATPAVLDDLAAGYPARRADLLNIGMLHTSADGRPGHERYAPCSPAGLDAHGYDYWALGHVHRREVLHTDTPIVFAGNLQGRGLRETGAKGATLLELGHDHAVRHEHRVLDVVRWELLSVDASGCASSEETCERVAATVRDAVTQADGRLLAARVQITGTCEAHAGLLADGERLRYEVIGAATDVAGEAVWIESVQTATTPVRKIAGGGEDAIGELMSELEEITDAEAIDAVASLAKILPAGVLEDFDPGEAETVRTLLGEVARTLPVALLQRSAG